MAKASKRQFEKALESCGASVASMERFEFVGWDIVIEAPEGKVFASTGTNSVVSNGWAHVGYAYGELIEDMRMGVRNPTKAERVGW